jgi:hypothetical protein
MYRLAGTGGEFGAWLARPAALTDNRISAFPGRAPRRLPEIAGLPEAA